MLNCGKFYALSIKEKETKKKEDQKKKKVKKEKKNKKKERGEKAKRKFQVLESFALFIFRIFLEKVYCLHIRVSYCK